MADYTLVTSIAKAATVVLSILLIIVLQAQKSSHSFKWDHFVKTFC